MKIAISGASGLVGSAIAARRRNGGDTVVPMIRDAASAKSDGGIFWNAELGVIDEVGLEGIDAVIHLAGENIASGPWTNARKEAIRYSRVRGTWLVAGALSHLKQPPKVLLVASATGYYGNRGEEELTEDAPVGSGFLADVCREWECAAELARKAGIRVVHLRFGVVLDRSSGMLPRLLPVFKAGLGGRAGDGQQFMSWITLQDVVGAVDFLLGREDVSGPVNLCSPHPVRNRDFSETLAKVLHRPSLMKVPAPVLRLMTGQMADEMILASTRAVPARLGAEGFRFAFPEVEPALRKILDRPE